MAVKSPTRRPGEEVERLGEEIYERDIRPLVEADHRGEYVAIDVESGCWAIAEDDRDAVAHLRAKQPDAVDLWMLRVGHRTMACVGSRPVRVAG